MLKPKEINEMRFSKTVLGYNGDEVDKFLDKVVEDYAQLCRDNADLTSRLEAAESRLAEYQKREESLRAARDKIYRMAEEMAAKAKADAARTEQEAREQAERIISTARRDTEAQRRLYERLQLEVTRFKGKAIGLFKNEIEQLNSLPSLAVDAKDELRIRADELSREEDAFSSPFVEEYHEKIRSPKEIDFGVPEEKPKVDLPPVDPSEDFAKEYLAPEEHFSGALGLSVETVNEPTAETPVPEEIPEEAPVEEAPVEEIVEEAPVEEEIVEEAPVEEEIAEEIPVEEEKAPEKPEAVIQTEPEIPFFTARPISFAAPAESEPSEPVKVFDIHTTDTSNDISVADIAEAMPVPPAREGRIEGGWYNETADFDMVDTQVNEKKEEAPSARFSQLRFGTDYDVNRDEDSDSSSHGFFFKKKK